MVCQNQKDSLGWFLPVSILLWFISAWEQANPWLWHTSSCLINGLLRDLWWPCFNQRYRWLFALHLSWYYLAILHFPQSQLPFGTSRNHNMNLTFLMPLRGSALPQSSPWHLERQELGESALNGALSLSNSSPSPPVTPTCTNVSRKSLARWGLHEEGTRQETLRARTKNNVLQTWGVTILPGTLGICSSSSACDTEPESHLEVPPSPLKNGHWSTQKSHSPYSHSFSIISVFQKDFSLITTREKSQWSNLTHIPGTQCPCK